MRVLLLYGSLLNVLGNKFFLCTIFACGSGYETTGKAWHCGSGYETTGKAWHEA